MINKKIDLERTNLKAILDQPAELAILPWGATEPHNLHLPYLTDAILSRCVALDAAQIALDQYGHLCRVLPAMPLGAHNPGQWDIPFCLHFRQETQTAVLRDIVASLHRQGIRHLVIINGHGGNNFKGMIRDLAIDYPDFLICTTEWFKAHDPEGYFDVIGDHADELETSAMMHYHPEWVDLSEAGDGASTGFAISQLRKGVAWTPRDWSRISKDTGVGDPRAATAAKGKTFAQACAEELALLFHQLLTEPLYH